VEPKDPVGSGGGDLTPPPPKPAKPGLTADEKKLLGELEKALDRVRKTGSPVVLPGISVTNPGDGDIQKRPGSNKGTVKDASNNLDDEANPNSKIIVTSAGEKGRITNPKNGKTNLEKDAIKTDIVAAASSAEICATANQCSINKTLVALNELDGLNDDLLIAVGKLVKDKQYDQLNALTGEAYASTRSALLGNQGLRNIAQARLSGLGAERLATAQPVLTASVGATPVGAALLHAPSNRVWANTWGHSGQTSGDRNAAKVDQRGHGVAVGGDVRVSNAVSAGLLLGVEDGKVTSGGVRQSRTSVKSYSVGSYASATLGNIDLQGGVIYSHLDLSASRNLSALGLGTAKASYKGYKVQAFAEGSKTFEVSDAATVSPYVNLTQTWLHTDSAKERGSAAALLAQAQTDSVFQSTLGVRAAVHLPTATPVALTAHLGWAHAFGDTVAKTSNSFAGTSNRFSIEGKRMDKNRALVGVGVEARITPNATLAVSYDGQIGSHDKNHAGSVQFKLRF